MVNFAEASRKALGEHGLVVNDFHDAVAEWAVDGLCDLHAR